ncbi:hypothetical protein LUZ60_007272 [Juncus effusus]|nr:hypothetical protein LUZ60_007272 [Juncus effusus]
MASPHIEVNQEFYFQILALNSKSEETQFQKLENKSQIKQKKVIRFKLDPAPETYFQESPSTSNQEEAQIESNSNLNTICPECGKKFASDKAMFGHMRIHEKKGYKGTKSPSNLKLKLKIKPQQKTEPNFPDLRWSCTAKRGRKPLINPNSPEYLAASILLDMSKGVCESNKKRKLDESEPLNEHESAQIGLDKKFTCETCNKSFSSHQALGGHKSSHRKEKGISVIFESVNELQNGEIQRTKVRKGDHVCEICSAGFATGQALGGHKRLHYNKHENRELVSRDLISRESLIRSENRELVSREELIRSENREIVSREDLIRSEKREMVSREGLIRSFGFGEVSVGRQADLWLF